MTYCKMRLISDLDLFYFRVAQVFCRKEEVQRSVETLRRERRDRAILVGARGPAKPNQEPAVQVSSHRARATRHQPAPAPRPRLRAPSRAFHSHPSLTLSRDATETIPLIQSSIVSIGQNKYFCYAFYENMNLSFGTSSNLW